MNKPINAVSPANTILAGVISTHEAYTLDEAKRRLQWTDSAVRSAKSKGLRLIKCGKRKYVSGKELLRFLESLNSDNQY